LFWSGLLVTGIGEFCLNGATLGGEWFLNHRKAQRLAKAITPLGARVFYAVIGFIGMGFGLAMMAGWIGE